MKTLIVPEKDIHAGNLILVNPKYPYYERIADRPLSPVYTGSKILLEHGASSGLTDIMKDINGWTRICAVSGWRSRKEQQDIYDKSLRENGLAFTKQFVANPGHSEHQTGLAIDLGFKKSDIDFIRPDFPYSGICQTFRENAAAYGFIERYPKGKEDITGIAREPWHFRYVGTPHAEIITKMGLTLEEYILFLKDYIHGKKSLIYKSRQENIEISYVKAAAGTDTAIKIDARAPYALSGNNADGFILTEVKTL